MTECGYIRIRQAIDNMPEFPQLCDIAKCINTIDRILKDEGY